MTGPDRGLSEDPPGYRPGVQRQPLHAPTDVLADRFELRHVLGTGGMATVWSAYDRRLGRTVAVKVLRPGMSEEHAGRIEREARAAARIDDPRVVTVLDLDHTEDGTPFLVLEALEGRTLADELRDGPLSLERVETLASDLLGGLGAAHACGVLHRDVKPANVLLVEGGFRITDFGIASMDDETATHGDLLGTLVYLAPERFEGALADRRTDVFAAGAVLYEALAGHQPFRGDSPTDSLARLRRGEVEPLPGHIPPRLAGPVMRALSVDPARRPADAGEFARMIEADVDRPTEAVRVAGLSTTIPAPPEPTATVVQDATEPLAGSGVDATAVHAVTSPDIGGEPSERTATLPRSPVASTPATPRSERFESIRREVVTRGRQPQTIFIGIAVLLLVLLLAVATFAGDGSGSGDPSTGTPAEQLEAHLDRIEELGR